MFIQTQDTPNPATLKSFRAFRQTAAPQIFPQRTVLAVRHWRAACSRLTGCAGSSLAAILSPLPKRRRLTGLP